MLRAWITACNGVRLLGVATHRFHKIRDKGVAPVQLDVDLLGQDSLYKIAQPDEAVVRHDNHKIMARTIVTRMSPMIAGASMTGLSTRG